MDLRHIAIKVKSQFESSSDGLGLRRLAEMYLERKLNKKWQIRSSNWEADIFDNEQVNRNFINLRIF